LKLKLIPTLLLFLALLNCSDKKPPQTTNFENLYKVSSSKMKMNQSTLEITLMDDSYIYFEDYNELKFEVFLNTNFNKLKDYEAVKMTSTQMGRDDIYSKTFSKSDLKKINDTFKNQHLKRNLYSIVNSFDASELWNFRSTVIQFSDYAKDSKKLNYIELVTRHSELQNGTRKDSIATQRIKLIKDFFEEEGIQDAWDKNDRRIDASNLVLKLNLILQ